LLSVQKRFIILYFKNATAECFTKVEGKYFYFRTLIYPEAMKEVVNER